MRWLGHIAPMGRGEACSGIVVGEHEGNGPLGRHRHRREGKIKMDAHGVVGEGIQWIELDQDRDRWRALVKAVMIFRVP